MWFAVVFSVSLSVALGQQQPPEPSDTVQAKAEYERIEKLVREGGLPVKSLEEARASMREAEDRALLKRTLYGSMAVEDLTEPLAREMVESAARLVETQKTKVEAAKKLIEEGVLGRMSLTPHLEELDLRRKALGLAESRARLWNQLVEMAQAEQQRLAEMEASERAALERAEQDPGYGILPPGRIRQLEREYEERFARTLPVSARGDTTFHRALGFNHAGRIDVALNPDSREGRWLRAWLERMGVPYIAFRAALRGRSSAPHIHIGPPSLRLGNSD
jgi:hypothetical protein